MFLIMEILGSTFDDSVFEESRNRVSAALPAYEPKLCEPLVGNVTTRNIYNKLPITHRKGTCFNLHNIYMACDFHFKEKHAITTVSY